MTSSSIRVCTGLEPKRGSNIVPVGTILRTSIESPPRPLRCTELVSNKQQGSGKWDSNGGSTSRGAYELNESAMAVVRNSREDEQREARDDAVGELRI